MNLPRFAFLFGFVACGLISPRLAAADDRGPVVLIGAAKVDITPELPIRLAGYGQKERLVEAAEVGMPLHARALAIGSDEQRPVVLITVELVGVGASLTDAVAAELGRTTGIDRAHVAVCVTHTHTGPMLDGVLPFMFAADVPADAAAHIARYTEALRGKLIAVGRAALADRKPARLSWGEGKSDMAVERRIVKNGKWTGFGNAPGGAPDPALPVLRVTDENGSVRAVFISYACHCTTLTGKDDFVHPDWAGDAAGRIEQAHPGAVALVALGCAGDANPAARGTLGKVAENGGKIAAEVERVLSGELHPLGAVTATNYRTVALPLDHPVTREELQARVTGKSPAAAYAAGKFLAQLDAGRGLTTDVSLPVQTWRFGHGLTMVFLGGEVVSDYGLRLKRELTDAPAWVSGYANAVPCYVAAEKMYSEGGYEVDTSMDYYGVPTRLAAGSEDKVVAAVKALKD